MVVNKQHVAKLRSWNVNKHEIYAMLSVRSTSCSCFQTDHDPRNPAYIATQGPLPHTVADFWQVRVLMATQCTLSRTVACGFWQVSCTSTCTRTCTLLCTQQSNVHIYVLNFVLVRAVSFLVSRQHKINTFCFDIVQRWKVNSATCVRAAAEESIPVFAVIAIKSRFYARAAQCAMHAQIYAFLIKMRKRGKLPVIVQYFNWWLVHV